MRGQRAAQTIEVAMKLTSAAVLLPSHAVSAAAAAATAERARFGSSVDSVTLSGRNGVRARVIALGATLQAFEVPDRRGKVADVTLGYDDLASYVDRPNYWGQTIGRYPIELRGGALHSTARRIS